MLAHLINAASVERTSVVVGARDQLKPLADRKWNVAAALDVRLGIGVGLDGTRMGSDFPGPNSHPVERTRPAQHVSAGHEAEPEAEYADREDFDKIRHAVAFNWKGADKRRRAAQVKSERKSVRAKPGSRAWRRRRLRGERCSVATSGCA